MPKIIINYKICDKAPECGGIAVCPNHALHFDQKLQKPVWDQSKCTFCLKCTLPSSCPVGAIMYAANDKQEKQIQNTINSFPYSEDWLWQERYGVFPSAANPLATGLNEKNFDEIITDSEAKLIDIWHPDFVDCRLHSPLFTDLIGESSITIFKLNAKDYPQLASRLEVNVFPTLLASHGSGFKTLVSGYITDANLPAIIQAIKSYSNL